MNKKDNGYFDEGAAVISSINNGLNINTQLSWIVINFQ